MIKIREGKISDWEELLVLLNSSPELQSTPEGETYNKGFVKATLKDKKRNVVLIVESEKKIVGFLTAEIWKDKKYSFLTDILIKKRYRKKGIASKLFKEYEKICKKDNLQTIIGLVLVNNKKMQRLVEKSNYKKGNKFYLYQKKLK